MISMTCSLLAFVTPNTLILKAAIFRPAKYQINIVIINNHPTRLLISSVKICMLIVL